MADTLHFVRDDDSIVEISWTSREDGDFHVDRPAAELSDRRSGVMAGEWVVVRQVHGTTVVDADALFGEGDLPEADALVTATEGRPISVQGADCAPVAFVTNAGAIGVAHAGWRGLAAGIIRSVANELSARGSVVEQAVIGPVICVDCYEFGADDLDAVSAVFGDGVRSQTSAGKSALDMRAGLVAAFDSVGVTDVMFVGGCPSCDETGFSHRARQEPERHCLVAQVIPAVRSD